MTLVTGLELKRHLYGIKDSAGSWSGYGFPQAGLWITVNQKYTIAFLSQKDTKIRTGKHHRYFFNWQWQLRLFASFFTSRFARLSQLINF